jgi:hypothetical protein
MKSNYKILQLPYLLAMEERQLLWLFGAEASVAFPGSASLAWKPF